MSERVARSRELVARGFAVAAVTRVLQVSRQAIYRTPAPRRPAQRRPALDPVEAAIVEVALDNQTDGYRMWLRSPGRSSGSRSIASGCCG